METINFFRQSGAENYKRVVVTAHSDLTEVRHESRNGADKSGFRFRRR
jgi:hypothetical protein